MFTRCPYCRLRIEADHPFCHRCGRPNDEWWNGVRPSRHEAEKAAESRFSLAGLHLVEDRAERRYWQRGGSRDLLNWHEAVEYVDRLNREETGTEHPWRLPALEELSSLLSPRKNDQGLYIDSMFHPHQKWCWSSNRSPGRSAYAVLFFPGSVLSNSLEARAFVRAVRSIPPR